MMRRQRYPKVPRGAAALLLGALLLAAQATAVPVTAPAAVASTAAKTSTTATTATAAPPRAAGAVPAASAAEIAAGQRVFSRCSSCHQIGGNAGSAFGPQLTGIVGRPAAAARDFAYSPAMKASRIVWTEQNLAAFVRDPGKVVPGTRMRFWGLSDERQIANLIAYLRSVK